MGGFYERLVKSVKTPLRKLFAKGILDSEQLTKILAEIEAQLNSRPLTYFGADPDDYSVITPSQILIGRKNFAFVMSTKKLVRTLIFNLLLKFFENRNFYKATSRKIKSVQNMLETSPFLMLYQTAPLILGKSSFFKIAFEDCSTTVID